MIAKLRILLISASCGAGGGIIGELILHHGLANVWSPLIGATGASLCAFLLPLPQK